MQVSEICGVLKEKIKRTKDIQSFRFKLDEDIDFLPGQFMEVVFDKEEKDLKHFLSFSSSPTESYIEFTKRLSESKFSQRLKEMNSEQEVAFRFSFGKCVFKEEYEKIGFIIEGIGITSVISMLEYIEDKNLNTDVLLIYTNCSFSETTFKPELDDWSNSLNLRIIHVLEKPVKGLNFVKGRMDFDFLSRYKEELEFRINFVFGSPKMVEAIADLLTQISIDKGRVKKEEFIGY